MRKLIAFTCVMGWSAFWVFGYLALSSDAGNEHITNTAGLIAGIGVLIGVFSYIRLWRAMPVAYQRAYQQE